MKLLQYFIIFLFLFSVLEHVYAQTKIYNIMLKPNAGSTTASASDIEFSLGNSEPITLNDPYLECIQFQLNDTLIYRIRCNAFDINNDGVKDTISFSLKVNGYSNSVCEYSESGSMVSMLGKNAIVDISNSKWGVNSDNETIIDIDSAETIKFSVEDLSLSLGYPYNIKFGGFISAYLNETNLGFEHKVIVGVGSNLESYSFNNDLTLTLNNEQVLYLTGGGSTLLKNSKEWGVESVSFTITVYNEESPFAWDPTDYSYFPPEYNFLESYPPEPQEKKKYFPKFSWDRIPRWLAMRSTEPTVDSLVEKIANHYQVVMLEKGNTQGKSTVEEGDLYLANRLKAINPDIKILFYWNSYIKYGGYSVDSIFKAHEWEWSEHTIDSLGNEVIYYFKGIYNVYNRENPDLREWWINEALTMANKNVIDGVFIDKCADFSCGPFFDSLGNPLDGAKQMVYDLYKRFPEDKLLIGNILRNERENGGREPMRFFDGSYLERWNMRNRSVSGQTEADAIATSIQLMREALLKGKIILLQTSFEASDSIDWQQQAQQGVYFPLAVFLIVADSFAYFAYQKGVNAIANANTSQNIWETSFIKEFSYPLGEPLGPPTKNGYYYTRSYKYLDVAVNIKTKETYFNWKNPDSLPTSINKTKKILKNDDLVYPNPFSNYLIINSSNAKKFVIYDLKGKEIIKGVLQKDKNRVETKKLKKGIYIIKLSNGKKIRIYKL